MAKQTELTKGPSERILYDIDVVAVWKPEDELDQETGSQVRLYANPNDPSYSQIPRHVFKQVTHRLVRSLEKLAISTTVPRALIQTRPKVSSERFMQLSPNGQYLAVLSDHKIEIRTSKSGFETNHAIFTSKRDRDTFPKWRRLSWSPDSKILAASRSDGTIEIIDENGVLVCVILSSTNVNSDAEKDLQSRSSFFLEPVAFLCFIDPKRGSNNILSFERCVYQYELLVITFDGILRSYLINTTETAFTDGKENLLHTRSNVTYSREGPSDPGYFAYYHKFSFKQWLSTTACGAVVTLNGLVLCLAGKSSFENDDKTTLPSVACWVLLPERPFYRKLELEGSNGSSVDYTSHLNQGTADYSGFFYRLINIFSTWSNIDKNFTDEIIHSMVLSPNQQNLLTLDFSGTVKLWNLSLDKGLELNRSFNQSELNYFARSKEFKDLSLEEFIDKVSEIKSESDITGVPGLDNGKVVSIGWWSNNALIFGYQYGLMIIACLPEMVNILGESPESFKSCREITSQCNNCFLVIEHEVKSVKARMINDGFVRYSREQEEGDMEDDESEEAESRLSRLISALANSLHYVTDTFLWNFENDTTESRGKIVTVSRKTYRLNRISKISPLELLSRKINALDYDDALVIAKTYDLDTDVIYQAQWRDAEVSESAIHDYLDKIHDREWVLSACIRTFSNKPALLRLLLNYGLKDTDILDKILDNGTSSNKNEIIKLFREHPFEINSEVEFLNKLQISERDIIICRYRHYFFKYLDRLRTYEGIVEEKTKHDIENGSMEDYADNDWVTFIDYTSTFADDYAVFRDLNIAALAMDYATEEFFKGLNILFTRHGPETLPYRFTILEQIPETVNPDDYESFLPSVISNSNGELVECLWHEQPWRDIDWVDNPILKQRILPDISQELEVGGIRLSSVEYPAPSTLITKWYIDRAHKIDRVSGQVDKALTLIHHGIRKNVMNLETLEENLDMLSKLVYDCYPNLDSVSKNMSLKEFEALTEAEIIRVFLQYTDEKRIVNDIKKFIIPFLRILPSRRARLYHSIKDNMNDKAQILESESEPLDLLHNYILDISLPSLELVCIIFEASKPSLDTQERIITSDEDLARIALACLYGNSSTNNWEIMTRIYECLPIFDVEISDEHQTNLDISSLQSYTPYEFFSIFKSKNEIQLQIIIDSLELHLNAAEILARYDNAVPLNWFLQSSNNYTLQKQLCIQLTRKSVDGPENDGEGFKSEDEWNLLLKEVLKLHDNGKGVLSKLSTEEIYKIFISSLLSCGKFNLARKIILPTDQPQPLDMAVAEQLVIDASREFFDNAPSGNMHYGYMKLAHECLQILPISDTIQTEIEFIEATHMLTEQKVYHQPGIPIHPMQIRLAPNKLDLIARLLSTNEEAYYDSKSVMELAKKLGYRNDKVAEVKVMAMLADAALRDSNLNFAYNMCIDIVKIIKSISNMKNNDKKETLLNSVKDIAWRICYEVAKQEAFQNLEKPMILMGYALALCPSDQAVDILNIWRKIDNEYRLELIRKSNEKSLEKPKSERLKPVVERVESSLLTPLLQGDRIKSVFSRFF